MKGTSHSGVFPCPNCGRALSRVLVYVGKPVACPYCGSMFIMPEPELPPAPVPVSPGRSSTPGPLETGPKQERDTLADEMEPVHGTVTETEIPEPGDDDNTIPLTPLAPADYPSGTNTPWQNGGAGRVTSYIIPEPARPPGITIISVLGVVLSVTGIILIVSLLVVGTEKIFGSLKIDLTGTFDNQIKLVLYGTYLFLYLVVCMGMMRGRDAYRRLFILLTLVFILGELAQFGAAWYYHEQPFHLPLDYLKVIALVYLFFSLLYLVRRSVRGWFD